MALFAMAYHEMYNNILCFYGLLLPPRLAVMYLYNAPKVFWGLWSLVKPFIDPVTSKKIVFLNPGSAEMQAMTHLYTPEVRNG